jgi:hypothetical protein
MKEDPMILNVKRRPIILSASTDIVLNAAKTAIILLGKFGTLETHNKQKNAMVNANRSL